MEALSLNSDKSSILLGDDGDSSNIDQPSPKEKVNYLYIGTTFLWKKSFFQSQGVVGGRWMDDKIL